MKNMTYSIDFIYERHGHVAIERDFLAEQVGYWKNCYEETKKAADEEIAKLKEELEKAQKAQDTWYKFWIESAGKCDELKATIERMQELLTEKDEIISGFGEEVGKMMLADEQKEALAEGDNW